MTTLTDAVLSLIRSRADLHRWGVANVHGDPMHEAVDVLEAAIPTADPEDVHSVTHRVLRSAITVIARADDSSGIIGDVCRRLLALVEAGVATYRARLRDRETDLGPRPVDNPRCVWPHSHEWFTLDHNTRRLAVLDRDIAEFIATHSGDRRVAAWLQDTAEAFEEIGEIALAVEWAEQAADFDGGYQSQQARSIGELCCTCTARRRSRPPG